MLRPNRVWRRTRQLIIDFVYLHIQYFWFICPNCQSERIIISEKSMRLTSMQKVPQQAHQLMTESSMCRRISGELSQVLHRMIDNLRISPPHKPQHKLVNTSTIEQLVCNVEHILREIFTSILDNKHTTYRQSKTDKDYHDLQRIVQKAESDIRGYLANQNALKLYVEDLNEQICYLEKKLEAQVQSYAKLQGKYTELQKEIHEITHLIEHDQHRKSQSRKKDKLTSFCLHTKAISELKLTSNLNQPSQHRSHIDSRTQPMPTKKQRTVVRERSKHTRVVSQMSSTDIFEVLNNKIVVKLEPKRPIHHAVSVKTKQIDTRQRIKTEQNRKQSNKSMVQYN